MWFCVGPEKDLIHLFYFIFFRATNLWKPLGGRGAYGGQVVGQALAAAAMTKPDDAHVHSLHCYFVKTGEANTINLLNFVLIPKYLDIAIVEFILKSHKYLVLSKISINNSLISL